MKLNRLADLENSDPKRFWADVNRIIRPRDDSLSSWSCIDHGKWVKHFQSLLRPPTVNGANIQFLDYVNNALPTLEEVAEPNSHGSSKPYIALYKGWFVIYHAAAKGRLPVVLTLAEISQCVALIMELPPPGHG